jgi:hypothetical protein
VPRTGRARFLILSGSGWAFILMSIQSAQFIYTAFHLDSSQLLRLSYQIKDLQNLPRLERAWNVHFFLLISGDRTLVPYRTEQAVKVLEHSAPQTQLCSERHQNFCLHLCRDSILKLSCPLSISDLRTATSKLLLKQACRTITFKNDLIPPGWARL